MGDDIAICATAQPVLYTVQISPESSIILRFYVLILSRSKQNAVACAEMIQNRFLSCHSISLHIIFFFPVPVCAISVGGAWWHLGFYESF
jgi:hypothetical protein